MPGAGGAERRFGLMGYIGLYRSSRRTWYAIGRCCVLVLGTGRTLRIRRCGTALALCVAAEEGTAEDGSMRKWRARRRQARLEAAAGCWVLGARCWLLGRDETGRSIAHAHESLTAGSSAAGRFVWWTVEGAAIPAVMDVARKKDAASLTGP
ncbi:hypothetical protein P280DRAFT_517330 [Massarina eburnea CBS 473.64]|uniref:Uncharacterized protein n=1 Tax=Massarina eburnea CBS 473.64 TaxID=1395130 RepID=A0A6A6S201_9PLEO|nr:hypothetical protein P280DRAFT_517330 [Massarina eburnea CBS 473.64]